eukprot:g537.t1
MEEERRGKRQLDRGEMAAPKDVVVTAKSLGISIKEEPHLLWVAKEACRTPLPPDWSHGWDPMAGRELYKNDVTGETSTEHPANGFYREAVENQRVQQRAVPAMTLDGSWMEFTDAHGERYYYSFIHETRRAERPQGAILIERPEGTLLASSKASVENDDSSYNDDLDASRGSLMGRSLTQASFASTLRRQSSSSSSRISVLKFKSWWLETVAAIDSEKINEKRYVDVHFMMDTGNVQVILDKSDKIYTLSHIQGRAGPLECWDLFVGARIDVLGRQTTLMQASSATVDWLDAHAKRLSTVVTKLEKELAKYDTKMSKSLRKGRIAGSATRDRVEKRGSTSLRKLLVRIENASQALEQYRPDVVDRILQQM